MKPLDQRAVGWLTRHDRPELNRRIPDIKPQIGLALVGVWPVARETVVGKQRPDVAVERDGICRLRDRFGQYGRGHQADRQPDPQGQQRKERLASGMRPPARKAVHHWITPLENTRFAAGH